MSGGEGINDSNCENRQLSPSSNSSYEWSEDSISHSLEIINSKGADVNAMEDDRYTPSLLCFAVRMGLIDTVKTCIEKGVDVNAKNKNGDTPLHLATIRGNKGIVEVLLTKGADVNAKGKNGKTPLHKTVQIGDTFSPGSREEVVKLLIEKGASLDLQDNNGKTPLRFAIEERDKNVAEALIRETLIQDFSIQKPGYLTGAFSTYWDKCKNKIEEKGSVNDESTLKNKIDPKDAQKNNLLTAAAPAALAIAGVVSGIAIAVYLEMLAVGIVAGAC